jgi:hypothetical protein
VKKTLLLLGLASVLLFAINALILTGHLSPDHFVSKTTPSGVPGPSITENDTRAAIPPTPGLDRPGHSAPLPEGTEELHDRNRDAPRLQLASTTPSHAMPHNAEIAAIDTSAAVVRSGPSASAPQLFAFPLGRRVRVGKRENGFVMIEDIGSGALGWTEQAALGPDPALAQRRKRDAYADATVDRPAVSKPREKARWARKGGRRGGLLGRLIGRR